MPDPTTAQPITDAELDAIEARANAATEGPWESLATATGSSFAKQWREIGTVGVGRGTIVGASSYHSSVYGEVSGVRISEADAEFIAASRTDVPRLVATVRDLRSQLAIAEQSVLDNQVAYGSAATAAGELRDALGLPSVEGGSVADTVRRAVGVLFTPRPLDEWHEDIGPVLWHNFPIDEAPYCGRPGDDDFMDGWHTHWTPLPNCNEIQRRFDAVREARA